MKKAIVLLFVLSTLLVNSGCASKQEPILTIHDQKVVCEEVIKPTYPQLDESLSIAHPTNVEAICLKFELMDLYIKGLERTIDCYKTSSKE